MVGVMWLKNWWLNEPKHKSVAIILALLGIITPFPLAGLHKIYLGQPVWGLVYFLLYSTPIPRIATAIDAVWYLVQDSTQFDTCFNTIASSQPPLYLTPRREDSLPAIAQTLRELDQLRSEGLISEGEFEEKRRKLLGQI